MTPPAYTQYIWASAPKRSLPDFLYRDFFKGNADGVIVILKGELTMKTKTKKLINADPLVEKLIKHLKRGGTRCGTGADMLKLRKQSHDPR